MPNHKSNFFKNTIFDTYSQSSPVFTPFNRIFLTLIHSLHLIVCELQQQLLWKKYKNIQI